MESEFLKDPDICPYCEEEMEDGYIVGYNGLFWVDEMPGFGALRLRGATRLDYSIRGFAKLQGKICINCKQIVIKIKK